MRKVHLVLIGIIFAVSFSSTVYAHGYKELGSAGMKAIKSPVHVVNSVKEEYKDARFKPFAIVGGGLKGLFYMGKDVVSGLIDAGTVILSHPHKNYFDKFLKPKKTQVE